MLLTILDSNGSLNEVHYDYLAVNLPGHFLAVKQLLFKHLRLGKSYLRDVTQRCKLPQFRIVLVVPFRLVEGIRSEQPRYFLLDFLALRCIEVEIGHQFLKQRAQPIIEVKVVLLILDDNRAELQL